MPAVRGRGASSQRRRRRRRQAEAEAGGGTAAPRLPLRARPSHAARRRSSSTRRCSCSRNSRPSATTLHAQRRGAPPHCALAAAASAPRVSVHAHRRLASVSSSPLPVARKRREPPSCRSPSEQQPSAVTPARSVSSGGAGAAARSRVIAAGGRCAAENASVCKAVSACGSQRAAVCEAVGVQGGATVRKPQQLPPSPRSAVRHLLLFLRSFSPPRVKHPPPSQLARAVHVQRVAHAAECVVVFVVGRRRARASTTWRAPPRRRS
jgi:hypothetical protein